MGTNLGISCRVPNSKSIHWTDASIHRRSRNSLRKLFKSRNRSYWTTQSRGATRHSSRHRQWGRNGFQEQGHRRILGGQGYIPKVHQPQVSRCQSRRRWFHYSKHWSSKHWSPKQNHRSKKCVGLHSLEARQIMMSGELQASHMTCPLVGVSWTRQLPNHQTTATVVRLCIIKFFFDFIFESSLDVRIHVYFCPLWVA